MDIYHRKSVHVKTAKGRSKSSTIWLKRQLNDQYVMRAKLDGYRSRAAYKLIEINKKFSLLKKGDNVIDLGSAPGSWSAIIADIVSSNIIPSNNKVIAVDILDMESIPGVNFIKKDFYESDTEHLILNELNGEFANVVLSDMAMNTTGHASTDHLRTLDLCENAFNFALKVLKTGGHFVAKIFCGGTEVELLNEIKKNFKKVKHFKPKSSRKNSPELYLIALEKNSN